MPQRSSLKTMVFEMVAERKVAAKWLNLSQNSFLISARAKGRYG